jgi:hypothetical protein
LTSLRRKIMEKAIVEEMKTYKKKDKEDIQVK